MSCSRQQMLINQSKQMLEYAERYPLRLLSLPVDQHHMVQRLKSNRAHHFRFKTDTSSSHLPSSNIPPSLLSSFRGYTQDVNLRPYDKRSTPSPYSAILDRTIHSRSRRERKGRGGHLTIMEEQPHRSRLSVLKELMERNGPLKLTRYVRNLPSDRINLQPPPSSQPKQGGFAKIFLNRLERSKREKQLRNALIISRVKQFKDLNVVVRKISSISRVPPL